MELQAKVYTRTNDNGTHYARVIVPKQLRVFVSRPALWRSLSTKSDKEALVAGTLVAAGSQLVFQELSDTHLEASVITVAAEIASKDIDIAGAFDTVNNEELEIVTASLKKSFGIKNGRSGNGGTKSARRKRKSKTKSEPRPVEKQSREKTSSKLEPLTDSEVAHYLERRPHGIYRFRFWIPRSLQKLCGQREVRKTLKTSDLDEAVTKAKPILEGVHRMISEVAVNDCIA